MRSSASAGECARPDPTETGTALPVNHPLESIWRSRYRATIGQPGAEAAVLATGLQFPDALAAGPVAAAMGGPLLLVHGGPAHPAYEEIVRIDPARVVLAGGEGALPAAVKNAAEALFTGPLTTPPSAARTEAQPPPTVPEDLLQLQEPPQPTDEPYIEQEDPRSIELPWLEVPADTTGLCTGGHVPPSREHRLGSRGHRILVASHGVRRCRAGGFTMLVGVLTMPPREGGPLVPERQ